jgi:hypothetical protein
MVIDGKDPLQTRGIEILAKSFYRELRAAGYDRQDVMRIVSEILAQLTAEIRHARARPET